MFMERSLLVEDELYGDEPHEPTALNWPPPMALPELQAGVLLDASPEAVAAGETPELDMPDLEMPRLERPELDTSELDMPELHLFARAARASRGPILAIGTAVTVALSGGYAAGHAFGWKMPPKLRASVAPALTTLINEQIPALVARPGAPLWCPLEDQLPAAEAQIEVMPSREPANSAAATDAAGSGPGPLLELAATNDKPVVSLLPPLRRPFPERERPAPPWHGVVWSPRANSLVSLPTPASATLAASQPAGKATTASMPMPFVH